MTVRRFRDQLVFFDRVLPARARQDDGVWNVSDDLPISEGVCVRANELLPESVVTEHKQIFVRWQPGGDSVKKMFQAQAVPPWWRHLMPDCYVNAERIRSVNYTKLLSRLYAAL